MSAVLKACSMRSKLSSWYCEDVGCLFHYVDFCTDSRTTMAVKLWALEANHGSGGVVLVVPALFTHGLKHQIKMMQFNFINSQLSSACLIGVLSDGRGHTHGALCCVPKYNTGVEKKHLCMNHDLSQPLFHGTPYHLKEWLTD